MLSPTQQLSFVSITGLNWAWVWQ